MDRREALLQGLNLQGLGLEIGAGYNPLVAGEAGLNVKTLDHLDTAGLIEKYGRQGQAIDRIQPVDYVWSGQRYRDLVGDARFDWIVASHVIEHVPDLIGFVSQCAEILTDDGVLTLAVPDRRYTFDYYRPVSGIGELVDAHLQGRTRSTPGRAAEHFLYLARLEGQDVWSDAHGGTPAFVVSPEYAHGKFQSAAAGAYVDVHAWVFTPHSFRLALADLHALGLMELREARFEAGGGWEFFVQLSKAGAGPDLERVVLADRAVREQSPPPAPPKAAASVQAPSSWAQKWFGG